MLPDPHSDRSCTPAETMARIGPSLEKHGITRLARLTQLDRIGIPVWNAVAPNSRSIVINQGKGIEDIDAKVSAAMEGLERAVAGNPRIQVRRASLRALVSEGFSADPLNALVAAGQHHLNADECLSWTLGRDIIAERDVWVPQDAVLLDDTKPGRFWRSSDGLASGNILLEAIFHGLLERIERDAEVIWQFASEDYRSRHCVDSRSLCDPVVDRLSRQVRQAGFTLHLFDRTSDVGVPCFAAFIAPTVRSEPQLRYIDVTYGAGAHTSPARAVIRAVTEAAQSRLTYISGARDDIDPQTFARPLPSNLFSALQVAPQPLTDRTERLAGRTLAEMLHAVILRLKAAGIQSAIVVDLNPGETAFSVAKVLVPGLENPDGARRQRFGPRAFGKILNLR